jgi:hypothetical protein
MAGRYSADERITIEAHQAAGIVAEQAHCDIRKAFALLFAECAASDRRVHDLALDVIDGVIRFDP